ASPRWPLAVWLSVSVVLLLRLALSYAAVCRTAAGACDPPRELSERARAWQVLTGGRRAVRLASSEDVPTPVATGPFWPSILIPVSLMDGLDKDDLERIGLHEAAHLARRDDYALLIQRFLEALFWPHPIARWVARQIDFEREIACGDLVVRATGSPDDYANCLTRLVALCSRTSKAVTAVHAAGPRSRLAQRVELLIDRRRDGLAVLVAPKLLAFTLALAMLTGALSRAPRLVALSAPHPMETSMIQQTKLAVAAVAA